MYFEYRSISDLNDIIVRNLHKFPHDADLVVGIPRSGMLPANLLALYLNKPFTDIDSFIEGRIYSSGDRGALIRPETHRKVLVVDDSINSGSAMARARKKLQAQSEQFQLIFAAIIATRDGTKAVDVYGEVMGSRRLFQWNLFHHPGFIPHSCFDIDGVLCLDPPVDDDGEQYAHYISHATPYLIPTATIGTLVTCRLEKYRKQTESWLKQQGISYNRLVMLDMATKEERLRWGNHGKYKGEVYKNSDAVLFVESSQSQAATILRVAGKPVFCTENFTMLYPRAYKQREAARYFVYRVKVCVYWIYKTTAKMIGHIRLSGGGKNRPRGF